MRDSLLILGPRSRRTEYVCELFFRHLIPVSHRLTESEDEFRSHGGPRLRYGAPAGNDCVVMPAGFLLAERGVRHQDPAPFRWNETLALFPTTDSGGDLPFDLFSAAFYLVSRYEEYLSKERDAHGRFPPSASVLHREGVLRQPVVNEYALHLRALLETRYPRFDWPRLPFTPLSTIDVDVAYAYRGRPRWRSAAAAARHLISHGRSDLRYRREVAAGAKPDPFDTFAWLADVHEEYGLSATYFILAGRGSERDGNLDPGNPEMQELIRWLDGRGTVGAHPSYRSHRQPGEVQREINKLSTILGRPVRHSRQHYLKFELPQTMRDLFASGIREDYSMGYAPEPGFRAGIAHPFPFYDLEREERTELMIHPLAYMDGTLREYLQLQPEDAILLIDDLVERVRRTGGTFISLWHNQTVNDLPPWDGWRRVFLRSLRAMSGRDPAGGNDSGR